MGAYILSSLLALNAPKYTPTDPFILAHYNEVNRLREGEGLQPLDYWEEAQETATTRAGRIDPYSSIIYHDQKELLDSIGAKCENIQRTENNGDYAYDGARSADRFYNCYKGHHQNMCNPTYSYICIGYVITQYNQFAIVEYFK